MAKTAGVLGATDSTGWTTYTGFANTYYVSDTEGHADNDGLSATANPTGAGGVGPKKTIAQGMALLNANDGVMQNLRLRAGDTFLDQEIGHLIINGASEAEPVVIDVYGSGDRPIIKTPAVTPDPAPIIRTAPGSGGAGKGQYFAFIGLDFHSYKRDPDDALFDNSDPGDFVFDFAQTFGHVLFEDCRFRCYRQSNFQLGARGTDKAVLRRCIFTRHYGSHVGLSGNHSSGAYFNMVNEVEIQESVFDRMGMDPAVTNSIATYFDHAWYINENVGSFDCRENMGLRGPGGSADFLCRSVGVFDNNLAYGISGGGGALWSDNTEISPGTTEGTNNVVMQSYSFSYDSGTHGGTGISFGDAAYGPHTATITGNIIANADASNVSNGISLVANTENSTVTGNVIFDWPNGIVNAGTNNTTTPNEIDLNGDNTEYSFTDPTRDIPSYMTSLGETATVDAFANFAINRARGTWDSRFTARVLNNYIRAGFDMAVYPAADTTLDAAVRFIFRKVSSA